MDIKCYLGHLAHVLVFWSFITISLVLSLSQQQENAATRIPEPHTPNHLDTDKASASTRTTSDYSSAIVILIYSIQCLVVLSLPQIVFNCFGLTFYNAFPGDVKIKSQRIEGELTPLDFAKLPHFCFRVVTRGLYPDLVRQNVAKNYLTCLEAGLRNFSIEVVTDRAIELQKDTENRLRQLVVPSAYKTSTGAQFKARALQYALEPDSSKLTDGDYIVHLDEETIVTGNVINGIINFALDGRHSFGQGLITYANQEIVNWLTTLADSYRVSDDMGKLRFQLRALHKPLFGWKGSFVVSKYSHEREVSFDHGPDGSIAEDCYFSMVAFAKGYSFDFIEGEMWEKSPFTVLDLIRQRKRWLQGILLVVNSPKIPKRFKIFLAMATYVWAAIPMITLSYFVAIFFAVPSPAWLKLMGTFCSSVTLYMYLFGALKSFSPRPNTRFIMIIIYEILQVLAMFANLVMENVAVTWALLGAKHQFYIVDKSVKHSNKEPVVPTLP